MFAYIKERNKSFYEELLTSKALIVFLSTYIIFKIASNITMGASTFTAIRSGLIGVVMYLLAYYIVNLFSVNNQKVEKMFQIDKRVAKSGSIIFTLYFVFLFIKVIDGLQRNDIVLGKPILSYIPGYDWLISVINNISHSVAGIADFIEPYEIFNIIQGSILYIVIPLILFNLLGYSFKGLFSFKNTRASWPFLGMYIVILLTSGLNVTKVWRLIYVILYPGLCEEFFHRGIIVRTTSSIFKKVGTAIVVGTILFSLIHFPDFYFRVYEGNLLMTFSKMADVFIFGLFMAYGFRKTGTLLPWILIHALSNLLNI